MLVNAPVVACLAVKDMDAAHKFYGETLGLTKGESDDPSGTMYMAGKGTGVFIYPSDFAGTNKATAATWAVDDVDAEVAELKDKGVTFEQYDLPGATREGDIHVFGSLRAAWFKDPWGNILNVVNNS